MTTVKIPWQGRVISAQPRIRLLRSFDESSHSYLGNESLPPRYDIYQGVWPEVERLRADNQFVKSFRQIECPILAIHGVNDPHPPEGLAKLFEPANHKNELTVLKNCGHYPWLERQAREMFFNMLFEEVKT